MPSLDDDVTDETGQEETGETDTGPEPPCALPEVEPNGSEGEALTLPLETKGCGEFLGDLDIDYWLIDFETTGWLALSVDTHSIGSSADPGLLVTSEAGLAGHVFGQVDREDIQLVFPTGPDRFHAMLAESESGQGGEGHVYEVMASWAKVPISYNVEEEEPNDLMSEPQRLASGDSVFGWLQDDFDVDWFEVVLSSGKQTLVIDVDAWDFGSAGDFSIVVFDEDGQSIGTFYYGEMGWEIDPKATLTVPGNQTLRFRIAEQQDHSSALYWYLIHVNLEGAE